MVGFDVMGHIYFDEDTVIYPFIYPIHLTLCSDVQHLVQLAQLIITCMTHLRWRVYSGNQSQILVGVCRYYTYH